MRALILTDASFAARERAMLSRLELGLADEGVRVIHALPERAARWHQGEVFSQPITYKDEGLPLSQNWRVQKLVSELETLAGPANRVVDVIHAFGEGSWSFATALASQTGAALAVEVWSAALVRQAVRIRYGPEELSATLTTPDPNIERLLREEDGSVPVRLTPWGVHTPTTVREVLPSNRAWSALLACSGRDVPALSASIEALAIVTKNKPIMIFADADAVTRANLWPTVRRLGLVDRFTMLPDVEARRDPVLRCDLLVYPEARGEHRSLLLDAMASGMVIIAAADPMVSALIDGRTASLVDRRDSERWQASLSWAFTEPDQAKPLGASARAYAKENCRASTQVAAVMDVYEWLTAGETIPFSPPDVR